MQRERGSDNVVRSDAGPGREPPLVPDRAEEDRDDRWGERPDPVDDDERLRAERPPHHDR